MQKCLLLFCISVARDFLFSVFIHLCFQHADFEACWAGPVLTSHRDKAGCGSSQLLLQGKGGGRLVLSTASWQVCRWWRARGAESRMVNAWKRRGGPSLKVSVRGTVFFKLSDTNRWWVYLLMKMVLDILFFSGQGHEIVCIQRKWPNEALLKQSVLFLACLLALQGRPLSDRRNRPAVSQGPIPVTWHPLTSS